MGYDRTSLWIEEMVLEKKKPGIINCNDLSSKDFKPRFHLCFAPLIYLILMSIGLLSVLRKGALIDCLQF